MQRRPIGVVLTVIGVVIAVATSIVLAVQPATLTSDSRAVLLPAVIAFVVVFAFMIGGAYFILTSRANEPAADEMEDVLLIADYLRQHGETSVAEVAAVLRLTPAHVQESINEMAALRLFSGYSNPEKDRLAYVAAPLLRTMTTCAVCSRPLQMRGVITACPQCETLYYVVSENVL